MRYLVTAEEMRRIDNYTTEQVGIPAMVLMERAALAVRERILHYCREHGNGEKTVLVMAGTGNNGGDGLALARLLVETGFHAEIWIVGDKAGASKQWREQKGILEHFLVEYSSKPLRNEYTILIDALFGVGLSRDLSGEYDRAVDIFNGLKGHKIAMDVPSGVDSDTGRIMGRDSVRADETVTFGFCKRGLVLYPGCLAAGTVTVADIGMYSGESCGVKPEMYALDESPEELMPARCPWGHKGTFGKVLLIAGSVNMAGAAVLAARAAYRAGAGMVKVITPSENRVILQQAVPEALLGTAEDLPKSMAWADVIAVGPGLGNSREALGLLESVLSESALPLLIDADGLNLLAENPTLRRRLTEQGAAGRKIVLTPHAGELARLAGKELTDVKQDAAGCGKELAAEFQSVVVAKDARTFICKAGEPVCVNLSGNSGMATAGSGDVLAGMIAGLMAQGMEPYRAACTGTYVHGCMGDRAAARLGEHGCMAGDIM